ncbi:30S ribosomal protein S19 [Candidatus Vidania fulgoroideorum]
MKIPFCSYELLKEISYYYEGKILKIKTNSRSSTIMPRFVGLTINVNNGKYFIPIYIQENMVGHKLGEFSQTRKFIKHSTKNSNIKKNV